MSPSDEPEVPDQPNTEANPKETRPTPLPYNPRIISLRAARELVCELMACMGSETALPHVHGQTCEILKTYYPQGGTFGGSDIALVATGVFDGLSRFVKGVDTGYGIVSGVAHAYKGIAKGFAELDETIRASCSKEETDVVRDDVAVFTIMVLLVSSLLEWLGFRSDMGGVSVQNP